MQLSELSNGEKGVIVKVKGHSGFKRRIGEMGFVKGKEVSVVRNAPLKDPVEYEIMGYDVSLRRQEADMIEVITLQEAKSLDIFENLGSFNDTEILQKTAKIKSHHIKIAFVGNPNAGKTTLFNSLSGANEKVGNYGGVTVDVKKASINKNGYDLDLYDLPGTYSLSAYSHEEIFVRNFIFNNSPDLVVNVIDASNLERNLFLTTQLIDMNIPIVIALNMYDELKKKQAVLDHIQLGKILGIPIIPTVGSKGKGVDSLIKKIIDVYEGVDKTSRLIHINYGAEIEKSVEKVKDKIKGNKNLTTVRSARYLSLKLLEKDKQVQDIIKEAENTEQILTIAHKENRRLENEYNDKIESLFTDVKYGFISGALAETYKEEPIKRISKTEIIDAFLTHKLFGFPLFFLFMFLMFFLTFNVGQYPMDWIDKLFGLLSDITLKLMPEGSFRDLLTEGIISGLGSVLVFLPNILILFFFISFMEDTGYMARAAFIMDKLMHKIGLHGKSFIPLLMGFGCNVPAILSTRILENRQDRLLTILINPFMSCSARLPVYILIIGAFFPAYPTIMLMGIYMFGIILAIVSAIIMKKLLFKQRSTPFVMELPPYRIPTFKVIMRHMWDKGAEYIKKVGGTILIAVIIIWALKYFPQNENLNLEKNTKIAKIEQNITHPTLKSKMIDSVERLYNYKHLEQSYLRKLGNFIEPIMKPIGLDWKAGISITTGIAAKEIVVSTLGVIYQSDDKNNSLKDKIKQSSLKANKNEATSNLKALSFLIFILIYFPCIGVVAAVKKETGGWKWPIFMIVYTTSLAWFLSFLVYQIGSLFI